MRDRLAGRIAVFIPTRHPKVTRAGALKRDASGLQIGSPEHDLMRLLEPGGLSHAAEGGAGERHDAGREGGAMGELHQLEELAAELLDEIYSILQNDLKTLRSLNGEILEFL